MGTGQGIHGSFSRADTRNTMAAAGPSFRQRFDSIAPASNADLGKTIIRLMGLKASDKGKVPGMWPSASATNRPLV